MIQTRSTIQKLLGKHGTAGLLRQIAFEIEQDANHLETVGARYKAGCMRAEVTLIRGAVAALEVVWQDQAKNFKF